MMTYRVSLADGGFNIMKITKGKEITSVMVIKLVSLLGIFCCVICFIFRIINNGNDFGFWIAMILCNVSCFITAK